MPWPFYVWNYSTLELVLLIRSLADGARCWYQHGAMVNLGDCKDACMVTNIDRNQICVSKVTGHRSNSDGDVIIINQMPSDDT